MITMRKLACLLFFGAMLITYKTGVQAYGVGLSCATEPSVEQVGAVCVYTYYCYFDATTGPYSYDAEFCDDGGGVTISSAGLNEIQSFRYSWINFEINDAFGFANLTNTSNPYQIPFYSPDFWCVDGEFRVAARWMACVRLSHDYSAHCVITCTGQRL